MNLLSLLYFRNFMFFVFLKFLLFGCSPSLYSLDISQKRSNWVYVDFDCSMGVYNPYYKKSYQKFLINEDRFGACAYPKKASEIFDFLKNMYSQNNLFVKKSTPETCIPKVIHQIWLGGKLPEKYKILQESWLKYHSDWEYKLWTDDDVENFDLYNKKAFDEAPNYAEKADILRIEILYQFGGLYVDTDFECLKPHDIFHENYEFYCGIAPLDNGYINVKNCLIASIPKHPILKHYMEAIKNNKRKGTLQKTGPVQFTKSFLYVCNNISEEEYKHVIAFPATYFFPMALGQKNLRGEELEDLLNNFPEAFGLHYWDTNWIPGIKQKLGYESEIERIRSSK